MKNFLHVCTNQSIVSTFVKSDQIDLLMGYLNMLQKYILANDPIKGLIETRVRTS